MTTKRVITGAHYGLRDWLAQRITALVLTAYSIILFVAWVSASDMDYRSWNLLFSSSWMKVMTLLAVIALAWHAWIGVRDIYMDYIKPTWLRLTLEVATILMLVGYAAWAVTILWRV